jgi:hypothetical protein
MSDKPNIEIENDDPFFNCSLGYKIKPVDRWHCKIVYWDGELSGHEAVIDEDSYLTDNQIALEVWKAKEWKTPKGKHLTEADRDKIREDLKRVYTFAGYKVIIDSELRNARNKS